MGAELGGERRHIQAEDGEREATIGGRSGDPGGPGTGIGLHHVSNLAARGSCHAWAALIIELLF